MNLLLDRKIPVNRGKQAEKFIHDLHAANPSAKWTITRERMNCDKDGNILDNDLPWFYVEIFKLDGVPIFELDIRAEWPKGKINDLRPSH